MKLTLGTKNETLLSNSDLLIDDNYANIYERMTQYHYCPKCNKVRPVRLVKKTASALIFQCLVCNTEIIDLGPLPL